MNPTPDADLLRLLREATVHVAPEEICDQLHWSPTQLNDRLNVLLAAGYEIEHHPHLGIKLLSAPDRLIADDLFPPIESARIGNRIIVFESTSSTNDIAAQHGRAGEPEGLAVFAESQTGGRGRLGRRWESESHQGLYFSLLLRPEIERHDWTHLTTWAAVAVARAIESIVSCEAKIKWPNDIYLDGKKAVGILCEAHTDQFANPFAIVGIGVNVNQVQFPAEIASIATSLRLVSGKKIDRRDLVQQIFEQLEQSYNLLQKEGFGQIVHEADRRSYLKGKWVRLVSGDTVIEGIAGSLNDSGALQIRPTEGGETCYVSSGEITVSRVANG